MKLNSRNENLWEDEQPLNYFAVFENFETFF